MTSPEVKLSDLLEADWKELRSEVGAWDALDEEVSGYDGYTRYWCKHAVLGVNWVAEQDGHSELEYMLTSDIDLSGFRTKLGFEVTDDIRRQLAEHVGWHQSALAIVQSIVERQLPLFEGVDDE